MAICAGDLDCSLHLAIDVAGAVCIVAKMAVDALHAEIDMDRIEVHGLLKLLRVGGRNDVVAVVEQIALSVALEDRPEIPTMPVIVGELRVAELWVELA